MLINDLSKKILNQRKLIDRAIARVLNGSWLILGPEVELFEKSFAEYVGVQYCRTVANGTDALELAIRALGVSPGDRVATVANAGFYTSTALLAIGASPLYMDVDLDTHLVLDAEVERAIRDGAKVIVITHLYGRAVSNLEKIINLCNEAGVKVVEDCAQAHGAKVDGIMVGGWGDVGCFSFYPTKNLGALGDGGAVVTKDNELANKISRLRQYGWSSKYQVKLSGAKNSRLDEMQAAILSEFLPLLNGWNDQRRRVAKMYAEGIKNTSLILPNAEDEGYVAHLYVVRSASRDALKKYLKEKNISTDIHYPICDYRQPIFNDKYKNLALPNTEKLMDEVLTLPCYPELTDDEVKEVIRVINDCEL